MQSLLKELSYEEKKNLVKNLTVEDYKHSKVEVSSYLKSIFTTTDFRFYIKVIQSMKHKCVECGYNAHKEALDFDHIDRGTKFFNIGAPIINSIELATIEMEKCQVLCANCHRVKTANERDLLEQETQENLQGRLVSTKQSRQHTKFRC